jgi:hypothetical protein
MAAMSEQEVLDAVEGIIRLRTRRNSPRGDMRRYDKRLEIDRKLEALRLRRALDQDVLK